MQQNANDLHMVQLMSVPPHRLATAKSQMVYLSVTAYTGCPAKAIKWVTWVSYIPATSPLQSHLGRACAENGLARFMCY